MTIDLGDIPVGTPPTQEEKEQILSVLGAYSPETVQTALAAATDEQAADMRQSLGSATSATALYEDFSKFPNGTFITRDSNPTTGVPSIGNPWRYSLTVPGNPPMIEDGALICNPATNLVYFGNDVGEPIRSISFEVDWRRTETLTVTPGAGSMTLAFHSSPVLNVNAVGINVPQGMLHIQMTRSGITDFGYAYTQGVNFVTIPPLEPYNGVSYWSDNFVTGNVPYKSKFIINVQFFGDTCVITAFGKKHTYRHPAIAQYPARHWWYETNGNVSAMYDYPRLHRVWANSPIMAENPNLAQSENLLPQLIGETVNYRQKTHIFNSNTDLRSTFTFVTGQNAAPGEYIRIGGKAQVDYFGYASAVTTSGNLPVSITGAGITGTRVINVAVTAGDDAAAVVTKIAAALNADGEFSSQWSMSGYLITRLSPGGVFKVQDTTFLISTPQVPAFGISHRAHISSPKDKAIETRTYTFVATATVADDVKIGANATATRDNLIAAINAGSNTGTVYGIGTRGNADHSAFLIGTLGLQVTANSRLQTMVVGKTVAQGSWGSVLASAEWLNGAINADTMINGNFSVSGKIKMRNSINNTENNIIARGNEINNPVVSTDTSGNVVTLTTIGGNKLVGIGDYDEMVIPLYFKNGNSKTIQVDINGGVGLNVATTGGAVSTRPLSVTVTDNGYGWLHILRIWNSNGADQIYLKFQTETVTKIGYGNYNFNSLAIRISTATTGAGDVVICGNPSKMSIR